MKARHITGITLGSVLAIAALIAPSVPIATQNGSMSFTEADGLCRSGLGELARLASARAQWDCSVVGHLVALAHLLVVAGLVTVGLCVWRGVVSRHQPQPSGHGFPQPPGQGYGVWPSQPPSGPGSPQPPGQGLPQPPRQG